MILKGLCESYMKQCCPYGAPVEQLDGMQYSFMSGAVAMFGIVKALGDRQASGELSEIGAVGCMEQIEREIDGFIAEMEAGGA